jgi:transcriptional regulator with XRE-family HTH domain
MSRVDEDERHVERFELHRKAAEVDMVVGPGMESDNRRFGEFLEDVRKHAGLSRADAAAKLGFSAEYLRLIEAGKRTPALGQMRIFLDAYRADGAVEEVTPGGDRPDLVMVDPLNGETYVVEFKSRIREARRNGVDLRAALSPGVGVVVQMLQQFRDDLGIGPSVAETGEPRADVVRQAGDGQLQWSASVDDARFGRVVRMLAAADEGVLGRVESLLRDEFGPGPSGS